MGYELNTTIVYCAKLNDEIRYVGVTSRSLKTRKREHIYDALVKKVNFIFPKAIRKYGKDAFNFEILETVNSLEEAYFLEKYYIKHFNTHVVEKTSNGYNSSCGGEKSALGFKWSEDAKNKLSKTKTGTKNPNRIFTEVEKERFRQLGKDKKDKPNIYRSIKIIDEKGTVYNSITEASRVTGIKRTTINASIIYNRYIRKHNKKFYYYDQKSRIS